MAASVVSLERDAWMRTFTLKELARRAKQLDPPDPAEGFAGWIKRMAAGRKAAGLLRPDPADDIADPYGLAPVYHARMVDELRDVIHQLIRWGPWS